MPDQKMFEAIDFQSGWNVRPNRTGVRQRALAASIDAGSKSGHGTRLVQFDAGVRAPASVHDYWEEIYLISGDLCLTDEGGRVIRRFDAPAFVCRGPGEVHGPFSSETGCLMMTIEYYDGGNAAPTKSHG
jgi:hypothetical protein